MGPTKPPRTGAFISYSHRDKRYLTRFQVHIGPFVTEKKIEVWDDTMIESGTDWRQAIQKAIDTARVAVLLVSADYLNSQFVANNELPPLLEAAKQEGVLILSVILSPCAYHQTKLALYQPLSPPDRPLSSMGRHEKEDVWARLATKLNAALEQINPVDLARIAEQLAHLPPSAMMTTIPLIPSLPSEPGSAAQNEADHAPGHPSGSHQDEDPLGSYKTPTLTLPQPAMAMRALLVVGQASEPERVYQLWKNEITLGRDPANDIVLLNGSVSRRSHATIYCDSTGGYNLRDEGSTNGTFLNGRKIVESHLMNGDTIRLGEVVLKFFIQDQ